MRVSLSIPCTPLLEAVHLIMMRSCSCLHACSCGLWLTCCAALVRVARALRTERVHAIADEEVLLQRWADSGRTIQMGGLPESIPQGMLWGDYVLSTDLWDDQDC